MNSTPNQPWIVRFGVFEANLKTGELRKQGIRIKIQEQRFQVLTMLLEKPGEIVTREEIEKRLWSENTFVDFDHSLNKAINKIRDALCDSADNPRFVETLARRGYRFIAPVEGRGLTVIQKADSIPAGVSAGTSEGEQTKVSSGPAFPVKIIEQRDESLEISPPTLPPEVKPSRMKKKTVPHLTL